MVLVEDRFGNMETREFLERGKSFPSVVGDVVRFRVEGGPFSERELNEIAAASLFKRVPILLLVGGPFSGKAGRIKRSANAT